VRTRLLLAYILAAMAIASAAMVAAYTAWSEQLTIHAEIDTGVEDVNLYFPDNSQPIGEVNALTETTDAGYITDVEENLGLQDIAETYVWFEQGTDGVNTMKIKIENAYPSSSQDANGDGNPDLPNGYTVTIQAKLKNDGSVPVKITINSLSCSSTDVSMTISGISDGDVIAVGSEQTFTVTIQTPNVAEDSSASDTSPDYTCILEFTAEQYIPEQ